MDSAPEQETIDVSLSPVLADGLTKILEAISTCQTSLTTKIKEVKVDVSLVRQNSQSRRKNCFICRRYNPFPGRLWKVFVYHFRDHCRIQLLLGPNHKFSKIPTVPYRPANRPPSMPNLPISLVQKCKYLDITITSSPSDFITENVVSLFNMTRQICKIWTKLTISIADTVNLIKMILLPKILYVVLFTFLNLY